MKLQVINDNEVELVFLIVDSSPEFNFPRLNNNELLMETKGKLKRLDSNDLNKMFSKNNEELKIYLFPIKILSDDEIKDKYLDMFFLLKEFFTTNENKIVALNYLRVNLLDYELDEHKFSKSFKNYIEDLAFQLKIDIENFNRSIEHKLNLLNEVLLKYEMTEDLKLKFLEIDFKDSDIKFNNEDLIFDTSIDTTIELDNNINLLKNNLENKVNELNSLFLNVKNKLKDFKNNL